MRGAAAALAAMVLLSAIPGAFASGGGRTADSDNGFDQATDLPASGVRTGSLDPADDPSDFYKFTAQSGQIVRAFIFIVGWNAADRGAVNFSLLLHDRNQKQVAASASDFQYETVSALAVAGGIYYLQARSASGAGDYLLNWSVEEAQTVKDGDSIRGLLSDSGNRNADWYRLQLRGGPAPDIFKATLHEDAGAFFDLYFMDLWAEYSLWYDISWWGDPDESVEAQATYGGWYYLWVSDYLGRGNYTLNITVSPGSGDGDSYQAGARTVPWNSSFFDSVDMAYDHYDWYRCELAAGESVKAVLRLDPAPADMFALSILGPDLATLEGAMKTNYVDSAPPKLDRVITVESSVASAGTYCVVVMARVGLKPSISDLSDSNARSDYMLAINFSAHPPGPSNHPPRALVQGVSASFDANTTRELDLATVFEDPDSDTLRFATVGNGSVRVDFSKPGKALLRPDEYYFGNVNFTLNATDPEGLVAAVWVDATVSKVPFPPVIYDRSPSSGALSGVNGTTAAFSVSARDPNRGVLAYAWTANGANLSVSANILSWKVPAPSGTFVIQCTVINADGSASTAWTLSASGKKPLRVSVIQPLNHSSVTEGDKVTFYAVVPGLQPAELAAMSFNWSLGGNRLASTAQFATISLPPGENTVEVSVVNGSDPSEAGYASVVVYVEGKGAPADNTLIVVAMAAAAAVATAALAIFVFRRGARRLADEEASDENRSRRSSRKAGKRRRRKRR